ncbi:IclR family transcriptional regulator [Bradyrhizobium sp. ma5]|uniref:IclR family transcriptional regulator n=1 Tax=Bradyrhizobium sp. ma5 TaxID=3344828 RepID=UPI0035D42360
MPALKQKTKSENGVQAVALALQIIETLAFNKGPQSVTELAKSLGTTKTRIFNYLRTLVEHGYAVQDPETERYRVGARVSQIGGAVANEFNLVSLSRAPMRKVQEAFGHTIVLSKFDGVSLYSVDQLEGNSMLKVSIPIGNVLGLHSSAQGKVVLAFGPTRLLESTIAKGLKPVTKATITDPERLRGEIKTTRIRGWATAPSETMMGVNAIAVPILDRTGQLVGTIAVTAVSEEFSKSMTRELKVLQQAAAEISSGLSPRY